jgi:hypothetical protein
MGLLGENDNEVHNVGWSGLGLADEDESTPLLGWDNHIVAGFGAYVDTMGYLSNDAGQMPPIEVTDDDIRTQGFGGYVRTPVLEMAPEDILAYSQTGDMPDGALALADDGTIYQYDGMDGFFKKLFGRVRKGIKKIRGKIRKGIRKLLKRTKFGRIILKVRDKIVKVMMKIVRPLMKVVGRWAGKLSPIAALIPGYGPVIAAGLKVAGRIAKMVNKTGAVLKNVYSPAEKKGGRPIAHKKYFFPSPSKEKEFHAQLKQEAAIMARKPKSELHAMAAKLRSLDPNKHSKSDVATDEHAERIVRSHRRHGMGGIRRPRRAA